MQILPKKTYIYLENQLLTHSGFRNSVALENLLESGVQQEQLTHDVLCKIAKKRRDDRDKVERNKDEQSARRAFTIDTCIFYCLASLPLLSILYIGTVHCFRLLLLLPILILFYCLLIHRQVADKNISYLFWGLAGTIFGFGITHIILYNKSDEYFNLFKRVFGNQHDRSVFIVLCIIGIISLIYALQYTRMSKETTFFQGIKNMFHFQAFTKYKSLKNRLLLITLIFGYFFAALLGIYYWDLFPFIACPILGYATLYVASKLSHNSKRHVLKYLVPIISLQFILLWAQYQIGILKALMIILPTFGIAGIVFLYLRNNNWKTWKEYILPIICVLSIALLAPILSLGYNFFNPKTWQYSRIYNGKITTQFEWNNFFKISDSIGNIGVMDVTEIIIKPTYYKIDNIATMTEKQQSTWHHIPHFLDLILSIGLNDHESGNYSVCFFAQDSINSIYRIIDISKLPYINKYSQQYISSWKNAPNIDGAVELFRYADLLDFDSHETKENFISTYFSKLFVVELAMCNKASRPNNSFDYTYEDGSVIEGYNFRLEKNKWIGNGSPDFDLECLIDCYNSGSLRSLLNTEKTKNNYSLNDIEQATYRVYKLFPYISNEDLVLLLDRLWNQGISYIEKKYSNKVPTPVPSYVYSTRAYYRMFARMPKKAETDARKAISIDKDNIDAYEVLALSLYQQGKANEAFEIIDKKKDIWIDDNDYRKFSKFFGHQFFLDLKELEEAGILALGGKDYIKLCGLLQDYSKISNYSKVYDIQNLRLCEHNNQYIYNSIIYRDRKSIIHGNGKIYDLYQNDSYQNDSYSNYYRPVGLITNSYALFFGSKIIMDNILFTSCDFSSEPMLVYTTDQRFYYINTIDGTVLPNYYECAWPFYNGLAAVQNNGYIGFIDKTGKLVIPYIFKGIEPEYYFISNGSETEFVVNEVPAEELVYEVSEAPAEVSEETPTMDVPNYLFEPSTFYGFESYSKAKVHCMDGREVCIDRKGNILSVFTSSSQP